VWSIINKIESFESSNKSSQETLQAYYSQTKDKEEWESVEGMITTIQAKIKLTGWDLAYAVKAALIRSKENRRKSNT